MIEFLDEVICSAHLSYSAGRRLRTYTALGHLAYLHIQKGSTPCGREARLFQTEVSYRKEPSTFSDKPVHLP